MSFQDELRINYQPKKQYSFSKTRVDRAAEEIVTIVKKNMLSQVKMGNIYEKKRGIFGQRERHDKKEFNELFNSLKAKCLSEGITVEIVKSTALHDDSLEYLFSSAC